MKRKVSLVVEIRFDITIKEMGKFSIGDCTILNPSINQKRRRYKGDVCS